MEPLNNYFPEITPFHSEFLKVSDVHTLHVEQCGNPNGRPIVFLHGGPGGGVSADHRRLFDPSFYRIILFDQRGSGKSTPAAELEENTTWDLVSDIEKIRNHLKIKDWIVFGGSWGSTLALACALSYPEKVKGLILRGIFLCRPSEIKWFYQVGASQIFPEAWDIYYNFIPAAERNDFVTAYHKRLTSDDLDLRLKAARIWSQWEAACSRLYVDPKAIDDFAEPKLALQFARIECHYFMNNAFFNTDNFILENIAKIRHIPTTIIQGRYDIVCPIRSAWDLHKAWPQAKLNIIADSGHSAGEPGIRSALITATEQFKIF
jgi:proline iminopeptidase